jgi:hypothetical protein
MSDRGSGERRNWQCGASAAVFLSLAMFLASSFHTPQTRYHARSMARPGPATSAVQRPGSVKTRRPPFVPVTADTPPTGLVHAVTPAEVAAALDSLPERWRETVETVRLCHPTDANMMAETDGANIELHYLVDSESRAPVLNGDRTDEEESFGGVPLRRGGRLWVQWPRPERLRAYVLKHLLIHEIGHHLAPSGLDETADEEWAETFAFRYYCPDCERL